MSFHDRPPIEQLAIMQALYKRIASEVSSKGDSLRAAIDEQIVEHYKRTGAKTYDVRVEGEKVGTYSVRTSKEKTRKAFTPVDADAYQRWLTDPENMPAVASYVRSDDMRFVEWMTKNLGIVPDGVEVNTIVEPEGEVLGTTLKVDEHKVSDALGGELPQAIAGLLEGE